MKKLFLLFLLFPLLSYAQDEEQRINEIRSLYKDVESQLNQCIKIPLTMFYDDDFIRGGSTEMEGYYDTINKEVIKIVEHTYYDWAEDITSYYFKDGALFFIFSEGNNPGEMYTAEELGVSDEELWEMGGEAKTLNYYEDRYYYQDLSCIRHLKKSIELESDVDVDMSKVENVSQKIDIKASMSIHHHGMRIYKEYMRQLTKKKN